MTNDQSHPDSDAAFHAESPRCSSAISSSPGGGMVAPGPAVDMGDLSAFANPHRILSAEGHARGVCLHWDDGHVSDFHYIWLRDNCACQLCLHGQTLERIFDPLGYPDDIAATQIDLLSNGALRVQWPDEGHVSLFDPGWLRMHCYSDVARAARIRASKPITWGAEIVGALPIYLHADVMSDDAALVSWMYALRDVGIALVRGVPAEVGAMEEVANRVSHLRETNFGVTFEVFAKPKPVNNAYTALALPLHTDLPNWEAPPGFQFLHCLANDAIGGDSLFADGFKLAEILKEQDIGAYELLSTVPMSWRFHDDSADLRYRTPAIALDPDGEITEVRVNFHLTAPLDVPADRVEGMSRAFRKLIALSRDTNLQFQLRLHAGDMIVFNNRRTLHARTTFDPSSGLRHLRGCYVDNDDLLSRIRVLERGPART